MSPSHQHWTSNDIAKGDHVKIRNEWYVVARVDAKNVTVETEGFWTGKAP